MPRGRRFRSCIRRTSFSFREPPCFTRGYGLVFGNNERKALSMSITDRALRAKELDEPVVGPAQNPEFVLLHGDNVDA